MGRSRKYNPGDQVGYWFVLKHEPTGKTNGANYFCRCSCGTERRVRLSQQAGTTSCGCMMGKLLKKSYAEKRKQGVHHHSRRHGASETREYRSYKHMVMRCTFPQNDGYHLYGGRGISVAPQWLGKEGFIQFLKDMGPRPEKTSLDRINPDGNYEPLNCRWADDKTQIQNRRVVVQVSLARLRKLEAFAKSHGVSI